MILAIFDQQANPIFPIKFLIYKSPQYFLPSFESIGRSVQEKKFKIDFQDGHHGFPIGQITVATLVESPGQHSCKV